MTFWRIWRRRDSCNSFNFLERFPCISSFSDLNGLNIPVIYLIHYGLLWILAVCPALSEPIIYLIYYEILGFITTARKANGSSNLFNLLSELWQPKTQWFPSLGALAAQKPVIYLIYYGIPIFIMTLWDPHGSNNLFNLLLGFSIYYWAIWILRGLGIL